MDDAFVGAFPHNTRGMVFANAVAGLEMGIHTGIDLDKVIAIGKRLQGQFPAYADSFNLKAGKRSDLHMAPKEQSKLG